MSITYGEDGQPDLLQGVVRLDTTGQDNGGLQPANSDSVKRFEVEQTPDKIIVRVGPESYISSDPHAVEQMARHAWYASTDDASFEALKEEVTRLYDAWGGESELVAGIGGAVEQDLGSAGNVLRGAIETYKDAVANAATDSDRSLALRASNTVAVSTLGLLGVTMQGASRLIANSRLIRSLTSTDRVATEIIALAQRVEKADPYLQLLGGAVDPIGSQEIDKCWEFTDDKSWSNTQIPDGFGKGDELLYLQLEMLGRSHPYSNATRSKNALMTELNGVKQGKQLGLLNRPSAVLTVDRKSAQRDNYISAGFKSSENGVAENTLDLYRVAIALVATDGEGACIEPDYIAKGRIGKTAGGIMERLNDRLFIDASGAENRGAVDFIRTGEYRLAALAEMARQEECVTQAEALKRKVISPIVAQVLGSGGQITGESGYYLSPHMVIVPATTAESQSKTLPEAVQEVRAKQLRKLDGLGYTLDSLNSDGFKSIPVSAHRIGVIIRTCDELLEGMAIASELYSHVTPEVLARMPQAEAYDPVVESRALAVISTQNEQIATNLAATRRTSRFDVQHTVPVARDEYDDVVEVRERRAALRQEFTVQHKEFAREEVTPLTGTEMEAVLLDPSALPGKKEAVLSYYLRTTVGFPVSPDKAHDLLPEATPEEVQMMATWRDELSVSPRGFFTNLFDDSRMNERSLALLRKVIKRRQTSYHPDVNHGRETPLSDSVCKEMITHYNAVAGCLEAVTRRRTAPASTIVAP